MLNLWLYPKLSQAGTTIEVEFSGPVQQILPARE